MKKVLKKKLKNIIMSKGQRKKYKNTMIAGIIKSLKEYDPRQGLPTAPWGSVDPEHKQLIDFIIKIKEAEEKTTYLADKINTGRGDFVDQAEYDFWCEIHYKLQAIIRNMVWNN